MDIGARLKNARKNKGITQTQLGKKLGVSQAMIGQYENGSRTPKIETVQKIADALNITMLDLIPELMKIQTSILNEKKDLDIFFNEFDNITKNMSDENKEIMKMQVLESYLKNQQNLNKFQSMINQNDFQKTLLELFYRLNEKGKKRAIEQIEMLTKIDEYKL